MKIFRMALCLVTMTICGFAVGCGGAEEADTDGATTTSGSEDAGSDTKNEPAADGSDTKEAGSDKK